MYKLLIGDDESFIADGLYRTFSALPDLSLEVYRTYTAGSALELFTKYRMDIIITDINMPGKNGLDMIHEIKNRWPDCRTIILSGYNDFNYAQTAIQYGADFYILKSQGDEALIDAVFQCIERLEKDARERKWNLQLENALKKAEPLLQQEFLNKLLKGSLPESLDLPQTISDLGLSLRPDAPFFLVGARIDNMEQLTETSATQIHVIFRDCLSHKGDCTQILLDTPRYLLWLVQSRTQEPPQSFSSYLNGSLESIQNYCLYSLRLSLSFLLEPEPLTFSQIPEACTKMTYLLMHKLGSLEELVLSDTQFFETSSDAADILSLFQELQKLEILLEQKNSGEFQDLLLKLLAEMTDSAHPENQLLLYYNLSTILLNKIYRSGKQEDFFKKFHRYPMFSLPYDQWELPLYETFGQLRKWLAQEEDQESLQRYNQTLQIIHRYIDEHLQEDISLTALAEQVYLNPVYLSRVYKQITGQNLSHYTTRRRVEKAMELLSRPELKINEIGYQVGYESPAHFSRTFKKITGLTPAEYRDHCQR